MRKSEANFLRFLRTSEKPQNYNTLKIIGKGAFGEVRLVQRKHDGKVYALKSLIKQEMVCLLCPFHACMRDEMELTELISSTRKTNWPTFAPSVTSLPTQTVHGS